MSISLVDSHCHLEYYPPEELPSLMERCQANEVNFLVNISVKISEFAKIIAPTYKYDNVFCSLGTHPCHVVDELYTAEQIKDIYNKHQDKIIGLGETGIDLYHDNKENTLEKQLQSFENHAIIAAECDLPLIIHSRNAEKETTDFLTAMVKKYSIKGAMHCFSGTMDFMKAMVDLGLYISLSGIVSFKNARELHEVAKAIPEDRLLIETDSPYLAPTPHRGKKNEPSFVKHVAEAVATLRNTTSESIAAITTENFFRLFDKARLKGEF